MHKKSGRKKAYYKRRLKAEFPEIYAAFRAGAYPTVSEAAIAAGLKVPKSPLARLKSAWTDADEAGRADFLAWLAAAGVPPSTSCMTSGSDNTGPISSGRYLLPAAALRIGEIMSRRHLKTGDVMSELGFDGKDRSLARALERGFPLRLQVMAAIDTWLADNAQV